MKQQFELLEFNFESVYIDLHYEEIYFILTASLVVLGLSVRLSWSVCEVVLVPYVDAVTVMRVLLLVLHVCMLRECVGCECDNNAGVGRVDVWLW